MTLGEIEQLDKEMLTPQDVSEYLQVDPMTIRIQARESPDMLGFPVIICKSRIKIPKAGFVHYCKYGRPILAAPKERTT